MASNRILRPFGLERFSFACARRLLDLHPEWLPFVHPVDVEEGGMLVRTLSIEIPSQNPSVLEPLTLSVGLDRIIAASWFPMRGASTWSIDWVFYFAGQRVPPHWTNDDDGFDIIAQWVSDFTQEKVAAIWSEDELGKGGAYGVVAAADVRSGTFRRGNASTFIRSWKGTFDRSL